MNETAQVSCIVGTVGLSEEGSVAENAQRALLYPLDQFRTFQEERDEDWKAMVCQLAKERAFVVRRAIR